MNETIKRRLLIILILATCLPLLYAVEVPDQFTTNAVFQYASSALGYIGITLLLWQLILGTRTISGLFFEDLSSILKIHKYLGKYGVLLIFLHPIAIIVEYSRSLVYLITPSIVAGYERHVTFGRLAFLLLIIIWVTSVIIRAKIGYRPWKYLHFLAYPVLFFSLLHVPEIGNSFDAQVIQFYWYLYIAIGVLCVMLRARYFVGFGKVQYKLVSKMPAAENTFLYRFRPLGKKLDIRYGQYVYIQPGLLHEEHPFTVLDVDRGSGDVLIAIKKLGTFTEKIHNVPIGKIVNIDGPFGVFTKELTDNPALPRVFMAGGIGITPFVKHALTDNNVDQYMFYANTTPESGAYQHQLRQKLGNRYIDIYSGISGTNSSNTKYGYITQDIIRQFITSPSGYHYFICGPKPMIESCTDILISLGVPKKQIHRELFGF